MTKQQVDFFKEFYYEEYPETVTTSEFNRLLTKDFFSKRINKTTVDDSSNSAKSGSHETQSKYLSMATTCDSYECMIGISCRWKKQPAITSWDVIGVLMAGTTGQVAGDTDDDILVRLYYSGGTNYIYDIKHSNQGFGSSVKLPPNSTSAITTSMTYFADGTGYIYGSYQHAIYNITLATSHLYTIGINGYGGVFNFYGAADDRYDQMGGVDQFINV